MQTFGWDVVNVVGCDRINAALAAYGDDLPHDLTAAFPDGSAQVSGRIGDWQIAPGGSGELLHVALPIELGELVVNLDGTRRAVDVGGTTVILRVPLRLVPDAAPDTLALRFDMASAGEQPGDVVPVNVLDPYQRLTPADRAALSWLTAYFLVGHPELIVFALATVGLTRSPVNPWLTPKRCGYAFVHLPEARHDYLAVLAVTTDRPITNLERTVDSALLPDATTGQAIAVSAELFLTNVVLPWLPAAIGTGTYRYDGATGGLSNEGDVAMPPSKVGAITYYPIAEAVSVATTGEGLLTSVRGRCDLYGGITMTFEVTARNRADFDTVGKQLSFLPDPDPLINHHADIPWYYWLLGPVARGIAELIVKLVADGLASALNRSAAQALSIARNPPHSVRWADGVAFSVSEAGVNGVLYLRGDAPVSPPGTAGLPAIGGLPAVGGPPTRPV